MATLITHRKVKIFVLAPGEDVAANTCASAIALVPEGDNWWTKFIAADGEITSYDQPYPSYKQALWAAKAAAEFGID
ncbi:MAG: hypothetical protein HYZ45_11230 [Burkholderiales bacterium]|nr:hypothetical protein [Burkholderiales bacterium]